MAQRRMFSKSIIESDAFLDMPLSSQALYMHLSMNADDDGIVNAPNRIMRMIGASIDDLKILVAKKFVIHFDDVDVIKHWRINNYIQKDRHVPTKYKDRLAELSLDENNSYTFKKDLWIQNGSKQDPEDRIDKDRIDKDRIDKDKINNNKPIKSFVKPDINEVKAYCMERKNKVNPERFFNYYESVGWKVGKNPMKEWKACVRTWEQKEKTDNDNNTSTQEWFDDYWNNITGGKNDNNKT